MTSYDLVHVPQTVFPDNRFLRIGPEKIHYQPILNKAGRTQLQEPTKKHSFRTRNVREMTLSRHMRQQQGQIKFGQSSDYKKMGK